MPSIKEYDVKLQSMKNTRKITKTMQMVAASKLRRAQDAQREGSPYAQRITDLIRRLAASVGTQAHPLLTAQLNPKKALVLVYTSDKGLCAGFNNNLVKFVERWQQGEGAHFDEVAFSFCGKRAYNHFRTRATVEKHYENSTAKPTFSSGHKISKDLTKNFLNGRFDEVYIAYNSFKSALSQEPAIEKLLPIQPEDVLGEEATFSSDYIFEPSQQELLEELLPRTISFKVYYALLENAAGEHGARMTAMDNATSNASSLIEEYTLLRNRARQAAITTELTEIVSGAEAL